MRVWESKRLLWMASGYAQASHTHHALEGAGGGDGLQEFSSQWHFGGIGHTKTGTLEDTASSLGLRLRCGPIKPGHSA